MATQTNQTLINFKVDSLVKDSAEAVLSSLGLSTSAYLGMCLRKLAQEKSIPFELKFDPSFWVSEAVTSKAVNYIKEGIFKDIVEFRNSTISNLFNSMIEECFENVTDPVETMFEATLFDGLNKQKTTKDILGFIKSINLLAGFFKNEQYGQMFIDFKNKAINKLEEEIQVFCEEHGLRNNNGELVENLSLEDQVEAMQYVLDHVLDAYHNDPDGLLIKLPNWNDAELVINYDACINNENSQEIDKEDGEINQAGLNNNEGTNEFIENNLQAFQQLIQYQEYKNRNQSLLTQFQNGEITQEQLLESINGEDNK